jgi:hypothetical protein
MSICKLFNYISNLLIFKYALYSGSGDISIGAGGSGNPGLPYIPGKK